MQKVAPAEFFEKSAAAAETLSKQLSGPIESPSEQILNSRDDNERTNEVVF